jgi:hypothetical protein
VSRCVEAVEKVPGATEYNLNEIMSDDLPNSDVADQLHDDLLVKWLTDSNNTGFSINLEKGTSVYEVPKTASTRVFLQAR